MSKSKSSSKTQLQAVSVLAPVCLFTYNRLEETKKTFQALKKNNLAKQSNLYVFSDGPKNEASIIKVKEVRKYLRSLTGFKTIQVHESEVNKGLAQSIIDGVTQVIEKYGKVIVVEDDLISSPNYLDFMNQALAFYQDNMKVFSISGYSMDLPSLSKLDKDYYIGLRSSSWGWGTWSRSWVNIDWEIKDYEEFVKSRSAKLEFKLGGSDLPRMLKNQMVGKIDSWAIRWCYNQFKRKQYTIFPTISKIDSIGYSSEATHTSGVSRFKTKLDLQNKQDFSFDSELNEDEQLLKEFRAKFSIWSRLIDKF